MTITVRALPVAVNDSYATAQDTALTAPAATGVLANDTSGTGAPLTAHLAGGPAHGTVTLNADGSFTYTPAGGFFGADTFTYTAADDVNTSAPATVTITVSQAPPLVTAPTAVDDNYATDQDAALTAPAATGVLANDTGTASTDRRVGRAPRRTGTLTLNADGLVHLHARPPASSGQTPSPTRPLTAPEPTPRR